MSHTLFIRFPHPAATTTPDAMAVEWLILEENGDIAGNCAGVTTLAQEVRDILALEEKISRVVVLVPGEHVLITTVLVHRKQKHQIAEALHYAVEEQLAASADSVHAALGAVVPGAAGGDVQPYLVAVIKKDMMDAMLDALTSVQIVADAVISEALLLPYDAEAVNILLEDDKAVISATPALAASVECENLEFLLSSHIKDPAVANAGSFPTVLRLYGSNDARNYSAIATRLDAWAIQHGISVEQFPQAEPPFAQLCRFYRESSLRQINLLQGRYKQQKKNLFQLVNVKAVAAVVLVFFALNTLLTLGETYYLQSKADEYHELSTKKYRALFPGDTRIVDLKVQMQQHLGGAHLQPDSFLALLSQLATKAGSSWPDQVVLHSMEYDAQKGELTLDAQAPDMARIETLKGLITSATLVCKMDSVSQSGNMAKGRIIIRQKSGAE